MVKFSYTPYRWSLKLVVHCSCVSDNAVFRSCPHIIKFMFDVVDLVPFVGEVTPINILKKISLCVGLKKIISNPCFNPTFDFIGDKRNMFFSQCFNINVEDFTYTVSITLRVVNESR